MTSCGSIDGPALSLIAVGAATPVGRSAWSSAAAVRAGIAGFMEHPFMVDAVGKPMNVAACTWIAPEASIEARISQCLLRAIRGSLVEASRNGCEVDSWKLALLVALPEERIGLPSNLAELMGEDIQKAFPRLFARIVYANRGHATGFLLLEQARRILACGEAQACLIAGADSYLEPDTLEWLEATEQLHGATPRNNAWGFVPGEGAGALLVMTRETANGCEASGLASIERVGVAFEDKLIRSGEVCLGLGLTAAFRDALKALQGGMRVTDVHCDMNGEPYRADEYGFAVLRTREHFVSASDFAAPADCWGDVGAASAPLLLVLGAIALRKAYAGGRVSLVWASSVSGERGAALLLPCGS